MLVHIALTAAIHYARRAPAQNVLTRCNGPRPETRLTGPRHIALRRDPRRIGPRPTDQDVDDFVRDVNTSQDRLESKTSRDHIPEF